MASEKKLSIRCRGIIMHDGKLLVVKHSQQQDFFALPGGHLEWGEGILECFEREIIEELGVRPQIGTLLYVHSFIDGGDKHSVEFFFQVLNGADYMEKRLDASHAHELAEIAWVSSEEGARILPQTVAFYFKNGKLVSGVTRFVNEIGK